MQNPKVISFEVEMITQILGGQHKILRQPVDKKMIDLLSAFYLPYYLVNKNGRANIKIFRINNITD